MSTSRMGQRVVFSCNTTLHGNTENELGRHMTTWINLTDIMLNKNKPNTKDNILYDFIYAKIKKRQNQSIVIRSIGYFCWGWGWGRTFWDARNILYLDLGGTFMM